MVGRFGEMSTLMNYMTQSFNFRGRNRLKPYYDLISNIATEELGHIELVSASINLLLNGPRADGEKRGSPAEDAPLDYARDARNTHHFIATGVATLIGASICQPSLGHFVCSRCNLLPTLLAHILLENAPTHHNHEA